MKYTTFRNTLLVGCVAATGAAGFYVMGRPKPMGADTASGATTAATGLTNTETVLPPPGRTPPPPSSVNAVTAPEPPKPVEAKPASTDKAGPGQPMRPMDDELLQLAARKTAGDKAKDVLPNKPYKINLYVEGGRVARAKVDLNRNDKWDEKWTFEIEGGKPVVKRQVSPTDDDATYSQKFKLVDKAWVKDE